MILSGAIEQKNYYLKTYTQKIDEFQSYLGEAYVVQNPQTFQKLIFIKKQYHDLQNLRNDVEKIQQKILHQTSQFLKLLSHEIKVETHWSKQIYNLFIIYQYYENSLEQILKSKKDTNFTEEELLEILYSILHALKDLQNNKKFHGDLRPECIVEQHNNNYKLIESFEDLDFPERVQKRRFYNEDKLYVCPTMYKVLRNQNITNIMHKPFESDIFSLGLILLELGLGKDIQKIYDKEEINADQLENYLKEFNKKFDNSQILKRCLKKMLEIDDDLRPTSRGLLTALPDYHQVKEIINRRRSLVTQRYQQQIYYQQPKIYRVSHSPAPQSTRWINSQFSINQRPRSITERSSNRYSIRRINMYN